MSECLFETYRLDLLSHLKSDRFRKNQKKKVDVKIPRFCSTASKHAEILAVLQDPGNSGAEKELICSLENGDTTSKNQIRILKAAGVAQKRVVFWNFYAAFDSYNNAKNKKQDKQFWADRLG